MPALLVLLALLGMVINTACEPKQPLPVVAPPSISNPVTRIVFGVDIPNEAEVCFTPTQYMLMDAPYTVGPVCGMHVGELRQFAMRTARAN